MFSRGAKCRDGETRMLLFEFFKGVWMRISASNGSLALPAKNRLGFFPTITFRVAPILGFIIRVPPALERTNVP